MIRVTRYYRWHPEAQFDRHYYDNVHMPMARQQLLPYGLLRLESDYRVSSVAPADGEVIAASHAYFNSFAHAQAALKAVAPMLSRDNAAYTNLQPEIRFSAVIAHV